MNRRLLLSALLLTTACQEPQTVNGQHNNGALFILHDIVVTSSDGSSLGTYLTATKAFGDNQAIVMEDINLHGQNQEPFHLQAAKGNINPKTLSGALEGGITIKIGDDYQVTTPAAQLNKEFLISNHDVQLTGPALNVIFDGASFNRSSGKISSLGEVTGEILPTAL